MYAPGDFPLYVTVSLQEAPGSGVTLQVPAASMEAVVDVLRDMAVQVADAAVHAAKERWETLETRAPGLIEERQFEPLEQAFSDGQQATRFLSCLAPLVEDEDEDDG
jgi:hypothetical protein